MNIKKILIAAVCGRFDMKKILTSLILFSTFSFATTINVPADYSTIQGGIDAANDGDMVLVQAGTYVENINFNGKNISVIGADRETTIIDGNQIGSVVYINISSPETPLLTNLTITNGTGTYDLFDCEKQGATL